MTKKIILFIVILLFSVSTVFADWEQGVFVFPPDGYEGPYLPLVDAGLGYYICKDAVVVDADESTVVLEGMDDTILTNGFDFSDKIGQPVTIYASYEGKTDEYKILWVKGAKGTGFQDTKGLPCEDAVAGLCALNVLSGYKDGTFRPEQPVTRAEMASLATRSLGISTGKHSDTNFSDVPKEHWASGDIKVAEHKKIMAGDDNGTFRPEEPVTFEEVIKVLVCTLGYEKFAIEKGGYPGGYIEQAKKLGLLDGYDVWIENPQQKCNRGILAQLLLSVILDVPVYVVIYS